MLRLIMALPLALLVAGSAVSAGKWQDKQNEKAAARLEKQLAGKTAGKPQSCIRLRDAQGTESIGEHTLLFRASRKLVYRTETRGSCRGVGQGYALVTRTFGADLCRGDMAHSTDLTSGSYGGHCSMGDFIPYKGS